MLLEILIPTYNRAYDLEKNLILLKEIICKMSLCKEVSITISDNCSTDETDSIIKKQIEGTPVLFSHYRQEKNIGLEANALFVLNKARANYVMYLGDDDYLDEKYLFQVIEELKKNPKLTCITPDFKGVTPEGLFLFDRDPKGKRTYYEKGFDACINNAWKAHQLSGLVIKKENVYEEYLKRGVSNIYPFIFFVAYSCLNGDCLYLPEHPVSVTQVPQTKKDWNYGKDGLLGEVFDNFNKLNLSDDLISDLEINFVTGDSGRFTNYKTPFKVFRALFIIINDSRTKFKAKVFFTYYIPYIYAIYLFNRIVGKINSLYNN